MAGWGKASANTAFQPAERDPETRNFSRDFALQQPIVDGLRLNLSVLKKDATELQTVTRIVPHDTAFVDPSRIDVLVKQIGTGAAERFVGRALEDLALILNQLERAETACDHPAIVGSAGSLAQIAQELGLLTLTQVSGDVTTAIAQGNEPAIHATVARLMRVGEQSLVAVWTAHDMSL